MSSLSAGTLNLKFMQRAAARNAAASPAKPASASPAATPAASGPATPAPAEATTMAAEDEGKWVLPRRAHAGPSRPTGVQVSFVASYLPFMEADGHGGGRRAFGGFGEKEEEVKESDEEEIEAVLRSDGEMEDVVPTRKGKSKEKGKKKDTGAKSVPAPEPTAPRTFQRPAGFDTPRTGDGLRATIAGMKAVSVSPTPTPTPGGSGASTPKASGISGKKRAHPAPEDGAKRAKTAKNAKSAKSAPTPTSAPTSLDEREKALKAAKKAQKKKNKAKK